MRMWKLFGGGEKVETRRMSLDKIQELKKALFGPNEKTQITLSQDDEESLLHKLETTGMAEIWLNGGEAEGCWKTLITALWGKAITHDPIAAICRLDFDSKSCMQFKEDVERFGKDIVGEPIEISDPDTTSEELYSFCSETEIYAPKIGHGPLGGDILLGYKSLDKKTIESLNKRFVDTGKSTLRIDVSSNLSSGGVIATTRIFLRWSDPYTVRLEFVPVTERLVRNNIDNFCCHAFIRVLAFKNKLIDACILSDDKESLWRFLLEIVYQPFQVDISQYRCDPQDLRNKINEARNVFYSIANARIDLRNLVDLYRREKTAYISTRMSERLGEGIGRSLAIALKNNPNTFLVDSGPIFGFVSSPLSPEGIEPALEAIESVLRSELDLHKTPILIFPYIERDASFLIADIAFPSIPKHIIEFEGLEDKFGLQGMQENEINEELYNIHDWFSQKTINYAISALELLENSFESHYFIDEAKQVKNAKIQAAMLLNSRYGDSQKEGDRHA